MKVDYVQDLVAHIAKLEEALVSYGRMLTMSQDLNDVQAAEIAKLKKRLERN